MSGLGEATGTAFAPAAVEIAGGAAVTGRAAGRRLARPGLILAALFVLALFVAALVPSLLAPQDPLAISTAGAFAAPGPQHLLGTDESGRDVLSRLVYGARPSLVLGFGATAMGVAGGAVIGLLAGLGNRLSDNLVMRLLDVLMSVPDLLLALVVIALLGAGTRNTLLAVGFAAIPQYARMIRAQTYVVRRSTYVEAARVLGLRPWQVVFRHVLPNSLRPVLVLATIGVGNAIAIGAALSFVGLGAQPPAAEWGDMLSTGIQYIGNDWLSVALPGVTIALTVLSISVVGRSVKARSEGRLA